MAVGAIGVDLGPTDEARPGGILFGSPRMISRSVGRIEVSSENVVFSPWSSK